MRPGPERPADLAKALRAYAGRREREGSHYFVAAWVAMMRRVADLLDHSARNPAQRRIPWAAAPLFILAPFIATAADPVQSVEHRRPAIRAAAGTAGGDGLLGVSLDLPLPREGWHVLGAIEGTDSVLGGSLGVVRRWCQNPSWVPYVGAGPAITRGPGEAACAVQPQARHHSKNHPPKVVCVRGQKSHDWGLRLVAGLEYHRKSWKRLRAYGEVAAHPWGDAWDQDTLASVGVAWRSR